MSAMKLILLRHGESVWNRDKRFTGWTDIDLSPRGIRQAERAGHLFREHHCGFDVCFTSWLRRATETLRLVLGTMGASDTPVRESWQLNERHYGALQGLTRWQALRRHGPMPVLRCQLNFRAPPPALAPDDPRQTALDPRYGALNADLPLGESLHDTFQRVEPYWHDEIVPAIRNRKRVLIVSHRNTLSVLVKILEEVSESRASRLKIPTGKPLVYELDGGLKPIRRYDLGAIPLGSASSSSAVERTFEP